MSRRDSPIGPARASAELVAAFAHEIATPMTTIRGYAELLAKSAADEKNRERAATIVEQVQRVSALTERLLARSHPPVSESSAQPVALAELIEAALASCADSLSRRAVRIERRLATAPPVLAEPVRLEPVLAQLLLAAIETTPRDGTLRIDLGATGHGEVELRVDRPDGSGDGADGVRFRLSLPVAP